MDDLSDNEKQEALMVTKRPHKYIDEEESAEEEQKLRKKIKHEADYATEFNQERAKLPKNNENDE